MRILHTMLRTGNLERSIQFYTEVLGMKLLRQKEYPDGKFTLAFIGYGDELNIAYPPKPRDSTKPHEYIWAVKLRNKSTGMLPLGMDEGKAGRGKQEERPAEPKPGETPDPVKDTLNKMKGILNF